MDREMHLFEPCGSILSCPAFLFVVPDLPPNVVTRNELLKGHPLRWKCTSRLHLPGRLRGLRGIRSSSDVIVQAD